MAPGKPFKTYSRGKKSAINSVEAFDILFTKNLTQRKLIAGRKKAKFEVKDLPAKVKCVLNEESSIHVNFNDTFDQICSKALGHLKNDSTGLQKVGPYENKTTENITWDSWFNRATPTGEGITNSLEIECVGRVKSQQNLSRSSPIVLRSHSRITSQSQDTSLDVSRKNNSKTCQPVSINIQCSKVSLRNNVHRTGLQCIPCIRQNPTLHSSTPLRSKKRDLLAQTQTTISPIKTEDNELRKCIVESLSEIKQWNSTTPKSLADPENTPKPSGDAADSELVDVLLVSFDDSKLKSENFSDRCLAEEPKNKQLVVNLTNQSLDQLKAQFNHRLSLLTPVVRKRAKACRIFSSNCNKTFPLMRSETCDSLILSANKIDDKRKTSIGPDWRPDHELRTNTPLEDAAFSSTTSQDLNSSSVQFIENSPPKKPYVAQILIASATDDDLNRLSALSTPPVKSLTTTRSSDFNNLKSNLLYVLVPRSSPQKASSPAPQYSAQDLSDVILKTPKLPSIGLVSSRTEENSLENVLNSSSIVAECETTEIDDFNASGLGRFSHQPIIQPGKAWRRSFMKYKQAVAKEKRPTGTNGSFAGLDIVSESILPNICEESRRFSCIVILTADCGRRRKSSLQTFAISGDQVDNAASTAQKLVLKYCNQKNPRGFSKMYPNTVLQNCKKIGEGVYGEVFLHTKNSHTTTVMKIIPIEGSKIINGEIQKRFAEILPEIAIVSELSNLRKNSENQTDGFCEVLTIRCVQGEYPKMLLKLWNDYDEQKGSENDRPDMFGDDQLYIVLELANAGQDLAYFQFNNALQAESMFQQVACNLAVAEEQLQFEHRDLHWGNVLLKEVPKTKTLNYKLQGKTRSCPSHGVEVTIIDFTLSRMTHNGVTTFTDLGNDPDLFLSEGDYQFDIYRLMKERNKNDWKTFTPYSNILWLHYILRKAINGVRYKNTKSKTHKRHIQRLQLYESTVLSFSSASEFVCKYF